MMGLKSYRELSAWQKSMDLVVSVYQLLKSFPSDEKFGLTLQMKRAAVSIPSNIAEGYGRSHRKEYLHFLSIAKGSLMELETQLAIAGRLEFIQKDETLETWGLSQEVGKLLSKLMKSLSQE